MPSSISWDLVLLAGLCCLVPCSLAEDPRGTETTNPDNEHQADPGCQTIGQSIASISFFLLREAAHWSQATNIFISPVSIAATFAMLSLGTKGDTNTQILEGLRLNLGTMPEAQVHRCLHHLLHTLQLADHQPFLTRGSSLLVGQSLKLEEKFLERMEERYHTEAMTVNFRDMQGFKKPFSSQVEQEVYSETVNLTKDLERDGALGLVDYISFHGKLNEEFPGEYQKREYFHVQKARRVKVPMFCRLGRFYLHWEESLSSWVLVHHYLGDAIAFFILPDLGKMQQLERELTPEDLDNIQRQVGPRLVHLHFPKLSISGTYDLKTILSTLGITKVFSSEANLSGVLERAPLKLSKAVHKAMLTFEEERTASPHEDRNIWPSSLKVKFNRPFLVIIKDEFTNLTLFVGKVVNPQ